MHLLKSEQKAVDFVKRIGVERAQRILIAIEKRISRRYNAACDGNKVPINPEWIRRTQLEVDLTFDIKMGLTLLDDYNTPFAAKARIDARLKERRAKRMQQKTASI